MTSVITLKNMVSPIANAPVFANIPDALRDGLQGYYWLANGEGQININGVQVDVRAIDYSGNGNHLTKVGAPVYSQGYTKVGAANGFNTGVAETASMTLMVAFAVADEAVSTGNSQIYPSGNFNTTTPVYGSTMLLIERDGDGNDSVNIRGRVARYTGTPDTYQSVLIDPPATSTSSSYNKSYANRTQLEIAFLVLNASNNTVQFYQPRVQAEARNSLDWASITGVANRLLTKPVGGAPIPVMIGAMDNVSANAFNCAIALKGVWNKALTQEQVGSMYTVAKAQLQGINGTTGRYASL